MSLETKKITRKISYVTISQAFSLLASALLILILPKYISVEDYGYWQLFLLYSGYVGLFHFGYSDGLYIKIGGRNLNELDKDSLSGQFYIFSISQLLFSIVIIFLAANYNGDANKQFIFVAVAVYLLIENISKLLSFMLLATDNSIVYSKSVLIDKLFTAIFIVFLAFGVSTTYLYVIFIYVIARSLSLIYLVWQLRFFFRRNTLERETFKNNFRSLIDLSKLGIVLTISNILGTLIIAIGRLFVERFWNIDYFAKISLSISLSMFLIAIISQVSLVLYPFLRNTDYKRQKTFLYFGSISLGFASMICFGIYFLIYLLIQYWLKNYTDSLSYLVYLFPIILFESKTQVIYTTYCKSLKKLRALFFINAIVLLFSMVLYYIAIRFESIEIVLISMCLSLMLRSILLNIYLFKFFNLRIDKYFAFEIVFSILFVLINKLFGVLSLLVLYTITSAIMILVYRKDLFFIYKKVKV